jgi:Peptidase family S41
VRTGKIKEIRRNNVLVGLSIKALDSFDRLIIDARDNRGGCSHHLKTMAECFIYSHWVSADNRGTRATLLTAEVCRSRAAYHENCSDSAQDKDGRLNGEHYSET